MIPIYLQINDFMCYEKAELDFSKFDSALVLGKISNNFDASNGAGKSTIFNAIEYALFNDFQDLKLDKIIRDGKNSCKVVFDFQVGENIYRIIRSRSTSGSTSVQAYECSALKYKDQDLKWKELSGRRNSDTEVQIKKIIKINQKSFRSSIHFVQNDFSGITTATETERKNIFKQIFDLSKFEKLEKISKTKESDLNKKIIKNSGIIESKQSLLQTIDDSTKFLINAKNEYLIVQQSISNLEKDLLDKKTKINDLKLFKQQISDDLPKIIAELQQLEKIKKDSLNKINLEKSNINNINNNIDYINNKFSNLEKKEPIDENLLKIKKEEIDKINSKLSSNLGEVHFLVSEIARLESISSLSSCPKCYRPVGSEDSETFNKEIENNKLKLTAIKQENNELKEKTILLSKEYSELESRSKAYSKYTQDKKELEINLSSKKEVFKSSQKLLDKYLSDLSVTEENISLLLNKKNQINEEKILELQEEINKNISLYKEINNSLQLEKSKFSEIEKNIFIKENLILEKTKEVEKINELELLEKEYLDELKIYQLTTEAFSSKGIPLLMITNLLDEIEFEANNYLALIKPGLEVQFALKKQNSDNEEVDAFDIKYFYNGLEREFVQLSGAMKFCATFSLKLAMSIILQKVLGTNIKFLLFDEIDQSLDKNSSDELINLINNLKSTYKILVITHDQKIKDKFNNLIVVEQNDNMISTIKQINC